MKHKCDIKIMAPISKEQSLTGAATRFNFSEVYLEDLEHYLRIVRTLSYEQRVISVTVMQLHTNLGPDAR